MSPAGLRAVGATGLTALLDAAVTIPSARIHDHVATVRARNPQADPAQVVRLLEKEYLLVVQGAGGAVGAAAALPAVGTGTAMALTVGDIGTFFAASAAFSLAVASVHGIEVEDAGRRRALMVATILGEAGATVVEETAGIGTVHFARSLLTRMPTATVTKVNKALTRRLLRRQAARQGGLALGRLAPFGVGAAIGVAGARLLGRQVIAGARVAFGEPPARFPGVIEAVAVDVSPRLTSAPDAVVDATHTASDAPPGTAPGTARDTTITGTDAAAPTTPTPATAPDPGAPTS